MADTSHETAGPGAQPAPAVKRKPWTDRWWGRWTLATILTFLTAILLGCAAKVAVHAFNLMP